VGPLPFTGGLIMFPLAALFGDVLTEVYGYAESRKVIWTGLASLVLLVIMIKICGALPADASWRHQEAYELILGTVPRIVMASLVAHFCMREGLPSPPTASVRTSARLTFCSSMSPSIFLVVL
jgi:queuosine precursor transporter